jgi:hypothetical protein
MCHLIYPASTPWHQHSNTDLVLCNAAGDEIARKRISIQCSGSHFWTYHSMFEPDARRRAGENAYIVIRDLSCRLFGYHGVLDGEGGFSLDHMFGF